MATKFNGSFRKDTLFGRKTLEILQKLTVGEIFEEDLFPGLPVKVDWVCVAAAEKAWGFEGTFCTIPFYRLAVIATENSVSIKMKEVE